MGITLYRKIGLFCCVLAGLGIAGGCAPRFYNVFSTQPSTTVNQVPTSASSASTSTLVMSGASSAKTGTSYSFTVTAKDANSSTVTGYTGTIKFTSSDSQATLPANYTFVAADNGAHTFSATFQTTGAQSIIATDTTSSSITGTLNNISVTTPPTQLAITSPASSYVYTVGSCSNAIVVTTEDRNGTSTPTTSAITVNFSNNPVGGGYYSDNGCTTSVTSATIASGSSTATVYFKTTAYTNETITAADASSQFTSGTYTLVTNPGVQWLGNNAVQKQWVTGSPYPAQGYGDGVFARANNTVLDSSGNLYVAGGTGVVGKIQKFTASNGTFIGWIGGIDASPTGGDTGCSGAAEGTFTPGWCTGGQATTWQRTASGTGSFGGGFMQSPTITSDGTYFYVANNGYDIPTFLNVQTKAGFLSKYLISTGAFQGWIGEIATVPTGGGGSCTSASVGQATPGWCTGGAPGTGTGDGMFNKPTGLTVDAVNNVLFAADYQNNRILKFTASSGAFIGWIGSIATVPTGGASGCTTASVGQATPGWCTGGTAQSGSADGMMNNPSDVKVDSTNDLLYVADFNNFRVLKFKASTGAFQGWMGRIGTVPTGGANGCSTASAHTFTPGWCTGGTAESDTTAKAADGSFANPQGLALSSGNNRLYVSDSGLNVVDQYVMSTGAFVGYIGVVGTTKPTGGVSGCTSTGVNQVAPGWCTGGTINASPAGSSLDGGFIYPNGLTIDGTNNLLYVTETNDHRVQKFNLATGGALGWLGATAQGQTAWMTTNLSVFGLSATSNGVVQGPGDATLRVAKHSTIYNGHLYVVDRDNFPNIFARVTKFNESTGAFEGWIGNNQTAGGTCTTARGFNGGWCTGGVVSAGAAADGTMQVPEAIALDTANNAFVVVDQLQHRVNKYTLSTGAFIGWMGMLQSSGGSCAGSTNTFTGSFCQGGASASGSGDGMFNLPRGIAMDSEASSASYIYVADTNNHRVQKFSVSVSGTLSFVGWIGKIATVPTGGVSGCTTASASQATPGWCTGGAAAVTPLSEASADGKFNSPFSVAVDPPNDALYVADSTYRISKIKASTGAFIGWIGNIGISPTGGASGCSGAAVGTSTPGWCTGGNGQLYDMPTNLTANATGFKFTYDASVPSPHITYSNGYLYVADTANHCILKYNASTGAFIGWMGRVAPTPNTGITSKSPVPTGGALGCNGAAVGTITPGWCTGGWADDERDVFGSFAFPLSVSVDSSASMLFITNLRGLINQFADKTN